MVTINLAVSEGRRSRARRRYRPEHDARPTTISTRRMQREAKRRRSDELLRIIADDLIDEIVDERRPRKRSDCRGGARPCMYVSCRFNLYLDVNENTGSIKINHPDREPWELTETCALDVAERGAHTYEAIGQVLNVTRERARQLEESALAKLVRDLP
jgi:hypothetical protein